MEMSDIIMILPIIKNSGREKIGKNIGTFCPMFMRKLDVLKITKVFGLRSALFHLHKAQSTKIG